MIEQAILKINPNAEFSVNADDINQITWYNGTTPISVSDIQAQFTAVEFDIAIANLREKRNRLLAETDYLALSDSTLSDDMKTYRQNLRDLPAGKNTVEKCENAVFPTKP
jgi:hypothetical protein